MYRKVSPEDLDKFHVAYGALLKTSMATLRKRDKKREKQRAEQQVIRKRKLAETIEVRGPKRGNGRRKRQRLVKAALRQEEARKKVSDREEAKSK
jgi:signal recognition particle subunit SRP14